MGFARFKGERSLSDLVGRLFRIEGPGAEAKAREAEARLLQDNPHLSDLRNVPEGTLIFVPELAGITPSEEARPMEAAAAEIVGELRRALEDVRATLDAAASRQAEETRNTRTLLASRELQALAESDPAVKERLPRIAEEAEVRLREVEALKTLQAQVLAQLDKDLNAVVRQG